MSNKTNLVGVIGISLLAIVLGCSRSDKDDARVSDAKQRGSQPNTARSETNDSSTPTSGESLPSPNNVSSLTETSADLNEAEFSDSDEPGGKRRDAGVDTVQGQPDTTEDRGEDSDDPNAEPVEIAAENQADNEPVLDDGREEGAKPNPELTSKAADAAATTEVGDGGRGELEPAAPVKAEDAAKSTDAKQPLPEKFQALDANKDGQIALAEWPRDKLAEFDKFDTNKDGFLSSKEWLAGAAKVDQSGEAEKESGDAPAPEESGTPNDPAVEDQPESPEPAGESDDDK